MKALDKLQNIQEENKSMICLGLDLDPKRMPPEFTKNPKGMFDFALRIVEATSDQVCAYKPNLAFYESFGTDGISVLKMIIDRIPDNIPVIVDAKRGDIGNTASHYAHALFEILNADWVTINPYMGYDSLRPFLEYKDRGTFILCLTSNPGSKDFQVLKVNNKPLYEIVAEKVVYWNKSDNCGLVVGATAPQQLKEIRDITEDMPLLIPGVGAQGGSLEEAAINGTARFAKPALINVSRSILYASNGDDFADRAREELMKLNSIVTKIRNNDNHVNKPRPQDNNKPGQKDPDKLVVLAKPEPSLQKPELQKPEPESHHQEPEPPLQKPEPAPHHQEPEPPLQKPETESHHQEPEPPLQAPEPHQQEPVPQHQDKPQQQAPEPPRHEPEQQKSDESFDHNQQNQNPPHAQPDQKQEPVTDSSQNRSHSEELMKELDDSSDRNPEHNTDHSDDKKPEQEEKHQEPEKPKPVQKITPPPYLKPPPLPSFKKKNDSDSNK